jgi:hypothetical protein
MKTLFEQLTKSALLKLREYGILYPELSEKIINDLKSNYSWLDINVHTAIQLCDMHGVIFNVVDLNSYFKFTI